MEDIAMQTAVTTVRNPETGSEMVVSILLDSGGKRTYISQRVANTLLLSAKSFRNLGVCIFSANESKTIKTGVTDFQVLSANGQFISLIGNTVGKITAPVLLGHIPLSDEDKKLVKGLKMADPYFNKTREFQVDVLIGNDFYAMLLGKGQQKLKSSGVTLLETRLGWVTAGFISAGLTHPSGDDLGNLALLQSELKPIVLEEESFSPNLEDLWKFETIGIKDPKQPSEEDDLAVKQFWDTVKFEDGRVSVKWLKKPDCPTLPTNFPVALCRLRSLLKNLSKNPEYSEKYSKNFQDQLEKGVIEKVTSEMNKGFPTYYIPHHAILTPQKTTTKMRVVFDASARQNRQCPSLNECLMRGPNLLPDLCGLLMRMRLKKVILIADIEKAFLQVSLQEPDRDLTRFLWLKNPSHLTLENNLQIYRFCRVPFGFKTSPFLLAGAVMFLLESAQESEKAIADQICNDLYVDNLITGCDDIEFALVIYSTAKKLFRAGNMNLREWTSNSAEFCQKISESDRIKDENVKVLGLNWNTSQDVVSISVKSFDSFVKAKTKRQMLGCIASIFDPLNLLGCLKVRGMIFLQKMWKLKLDWDDEVPVDLLNEWRSLIGCFKSIQEITFPRCPFVGNEDSVLDLLCFADASKEAYAAVIYLRSETGNKSGKVSLIFSKTRLVPVSGMTIPRAELMAVLIATRCLNYVTTQLKLNIRHFYLWSDSQVVLGWIRNEARDQGVFVTNRILEILKFKNITYQYVPSGQNPADLATKTRDSSYQIPWHFWINGPEWLKSPCQDWPKFENRSENATKKTVEVILLGGGPQSKTCGKIKTNLEVLIEVQKHSFFSALVRVTAWVKRFIQILKNKVEQSKSTNVHPMRTRAKGKAYGKIKDVAPLSQEDIRNAQKLWIAEVQRKEFPDLFTEKIVRSTFAQNLGIKVGDDNILRCHGRLGESNLSSEAKYPMLLPPNSELTILIIRTFHKYAFHAGVNHTLTKVRSMFWIPKGRKVISKVVKSCSVCKRISAKPFAHPVMPNLPAERVTEAVPFSHTGVDYFGPLYCRELSNPKKEMKVWVVLFTCLSIRAVHLELVTDMSAETFLRALRRFVSRRGKPKVILSDNALQFKLTKQVMSLGEKLSLSQQVKNHLYQEGIIWKFIPALTPWAGGVYERMVGITKMALKKALGRSCLSEDQLRTILVEVEEVVNSRPITFVSMTDNDSDLEILTPQKFLSCGRNERLPIIPEGDISDPSDPEVIQRPSTHAKVMNSWKQAQYHLNRFWQIWRNDYLLNLRERHKSDKFPKRKSQVFRAPRLGELVLIKSENQPRGMWKLGRVVKLHEGRDSLIRSAEVRVTGSKENITRPVSLLYPLEIQSENEPDSSEFGQLASEFLISFESFEDEIFPRVSGRLYSGFARVSGSPYPDCRAVKPSPCISETNCLILENCLDQREFDADSISSYVEPLTDEELEVEKTPKLRDLRERINERRAKSLSQKGKRGTQAPLRSLGKEKKNPSKNPPNPKPQKKPEVKSPQKVIPNQGTKPGMGGNHPKPFGQNQKQSWKYYKSPVAGMNFCKIKCERCGKMRPQKYEHCYCKMRVQWRKNRKQNQVRHNQRDHSRQPPVMNSIPPASNFNGGLPPPPPFVPPVAPFASSFPTAMPLSPFPFAPPSNQLPFLPPGNVASVEFHPNGSIAKCVYK